AARTRAAGATTRQRVVGVPTWQRLVGAPTWQRPVAAATRRTAGAPVRTALAALVAVLLVSCSGGQGAGPSPASWTGHGQADADPAGVAVDGDLVVLAAASLTDAFGQIADAFRSEHPDVAVTVSFAGSSSLAQQVLAG